MPSVSAASADAPAGAGLGPDPSSVAALASALRGLIDDADRAGAELRLLEAGAERRGAVANQASVRLQERLHLGARMLQAIQDRIDAASDLVLLDRADCPCPTPRSVQRRIVRLTRAAVARIRREDEAHRARLEAMEMRFAGLVERAERLAETIESAEVNLAAAMRRVNAAG